MTLETKLFAISFSIIFLTAFLFLTFAWTTVRKLKKKPLTKETLGFEFVSGWNVLNIAQALSLPRFITNKTKNTPTFYLHANADLLRAHTNNFDRRLARILYYSYLIGASSMIFLVILSSLEAFN